jgi:hypothetical protein
MVVRLVVEFESDPEVVAAIIGGVAVIMAALIGGFFMIWSARIQVPRQPPELPPPPPRRWHHGTGLAVQRGEPAAQCNPGAVCARPGCQRRARESP